jgi:hypothetical protein
MKDWAIKKFFTKKEKKPLPKNYGQGISRKSKQRRRNALYYKAGDRHGFGAATLLGISLLAMANWPIEDRDRWAYLFIAALGITHLVWGHNLKKLADKDKTK